MRVWMVVGLLTLAGAAGGCTTVEPIRRADGSLEYVIGCGTGLPLDVCYSRANRLCPDGYSTVSESVGFTGREVRIACPLPAARVEAIGAAPISVPVAAGPAPAPNSRPIRQPRRFASPAANSEADQAERRRSLGVRPSDVADCRSRANTGLMPPDEREALLNDCLASRRHRRHGR